MKLLSLFTGIGAFEEGLKRAGIDYELVNFCEFDDVPAKAYCLIHGEDPSKNLGDITKVNEKSLPDFDYMTYGFPCQSYSVAGERLGFDDPERGDLFFHSMRIAREKQPKFMIGENVYGLVTHDRGNTLKVVLNTLDYIGYNTYHAVLNSVNYGAAQSRDRIFFVSIRKDIDKGFEFPEPSNERTSLKDVIENRPRKPMKVNLQPYNKRSYFTKQYSSGKGVVKLFDGVSEGYFSSSFCSNRIYSIEGASPTLTTKNDTVFHEIGGHLTPRERFIIQGFNPDYVDILMDHNIPVGKIDKMSGNSINVDVICAIQKKLFAEYTNEVR